MSEAERAEVLSALDRARATALRSLSNRARRLLAESAVIHELGPGASLGGVEAWYHGQCLVLSGQASVMLYPPRPTARAIPEDEVAPSEPMLEVALVKRGDTFGWHRQHKADLTDEEILLQETWDNCSPEVVVPANQKLKFARLEDSDDHRGEHRGSKGASGHALKAQKSASKTKLLSKEDEHAARPLQGLHANGVTSTFNFLPSAPTSSFLAQLWLTSTPPLEGIADNTAANGGLLPRAHFQAALWTPLCDCLDQLNEEIRRRQRAKYRIHDCFPLQGHQIVELKHYIIHLTEIWYGARRGGNLSILYSWFVDAMGVLGVTAYSYDDLPVDKSSDAWATVIDGDARRRALQGRTGMDSAYVATGGVAQKQGRSAIDNTVLRNVFYPWEARELLVGRMARKFLSRLLALRQRSILRRLAQHLQLDVLHLAQDARMHRSLRSILAATSDEEIKVLGLDPQDRLLLLLRRTGAEIAGFGQLDEGMQRSVWETAKTLLKETATPLQQEPAEGTPKDVFARFVVWSREYPGEFFEHDKSRHVTVKIAGMFSRRIVVVKRSAMERMTLARYFPLTWKRQQPLWGSASTGHFQVRPAGVKEGSHVRANECPYAGLHGMALSAGGFASDQRCNPDRKIVGYTLLMELQWIRDPQANIENWYITDIEKIIQEAWQLNPHGPASIMLAGEKFLAVGQNPKVGSSIRQTQHTQLAKGSWKNYPVLQIPASRILASEAADVPDTPGAEVCKLKGDCLGSHAVLELVDIGPEGSELDQRGTMLRIRIPQPASHGLMRFLVRMRLRLLEKLGGAEAIDFLVLCLSDEEGGFVVIFSPIPQLVMMEAGHPDLVPWANPLTGESSETAGIEESRLDFGKGVGHFLVLKAALREQLLAKGEDTLRRIYGFNRVPGARAVIDEFLDSENVIERPPE